MINTSPKDLGMLDLSQESFTVILIGLTNTLQRTGIPETVARRVLGHHKVPTIAPSSTYITSPRATSPFISMDTTLYDTIYSNLHSTVTKQAPATNTHATQIEP